MATAPDILAVVTPADHVVGPAQGEWTYADYARIPDDGQRYEVIEGVLYMAPAPTEPHQAANGWFVFYLIAHVQVPSLGRVYPAPFDVVLPSGATTQPDVLVVLNANFDIITPEKIVGAPDLVVEIASPSTATYDRSKKLGAYERAGVHEYWIVDPFAHTVELLVLEQDRYRSLGVFRGAAKLPSTVVPGLPVRVEQFFA